MRTILVSILALFVVFAGLHHLEARINFTESAPIGLYLPTKQGLERGAWVAFCLPESTFLPTAREYDYLGSSWLCESGLTPLLKPLKGLPGDVVRLEPEGVYVNNDLLPKSQIRLADSKGRALPKSLLTSGTIPQGFGLVMSDHAGGFDGRYFGFMSLDSLRVYTPILTF